jgi:putative copper resistance protein D
MTGGAAAVLVRWLHLAAATTVVGSFGFLILVARPIGPPAGADDAGPLRDADRRLLRLGGWALAITLAAGLLDLSRQVGVATGRGVLASLDLATWLLVLSETHYGAVWLARHAVLLLLAAVALARDAETGPADRLAFRLEGLALGAGSLGLGAAAGHAAATDTAGSTAVIVDALHLLATGIWLGALAPFAGFLRDTAPLPAAARVAVAATASRRFSAIGLAAVLALAVTGVYNAWQQVGNWAPLFGTGYGRWLCAKLGLLLPLLAVAGVNRLVIRPALAAESDAAPALVRRLTRLLCAEAALGALVLLAVAVLGLTTPARHEAVAWPLDFRLAWDVARDLPGVRARVAIGSQLAVFGLVAALLAAIVRRRRWPAGVAAGVVLVTAGAGVALPPLAIDAYPTTYVRPTVAYTATSIAAGRALYAQHCVACHGASGRGDGPAGTALHPPPADLTARHTGDHTAGDIFWWLTHGIRAMPGFGAQLGDEARWDLVNTVRALAAAEEARQLDAVVAPPAGPLVVAPDFAYTTGVGEGGALRDQRGSRSVLLVLFTLPASRARLAALEERYGDVRARRAEILALPLGDAARVYRDLGTTLTSYPVVVEGAAEAAATYALFRRDLTAAGQLSDPPLPPHMELLIDRQGYVRARWIPDGRASGWADPVRLLGELDRLAAESSARPAPEEHVH